ncbi:MAG: acylneuraminate cytidylyltransferase family protein [Thermodesulfobacteriota bacterium]|nr:acylneuraminate cytidylyltransferase family protein [Thermodesulfobacteriota bacterium]
MKVTALVPMKGHSERVPRKNLAPFMGRPLCHWILTALMSAETIDEIVVDTDSSEVERAVKRLSDSIVVIPRPVAICGDYISMNQVIGHDVQNTDADVYLQTHSTNPLLSWETIDSAVQEFMAQAAEGNIDSLFSVTRHQGRFFDKDLSPVNHDPATLVPTQHLDPLFEENSNLYIFTRQSFETTGARIGRRPAMFETPAFESFDIDTPDDFLLAEVVARGRRAADTASAI